MNRFLLGCTAAFTLLASSASAQSVVIVNGQKVLVPAPTTQKPLTPGVQPTTTPKTGGAPGFYPGSSHTSWLVGGSNDCATADPISGAGTFSVNTAGATDSTQQTGFCPTAHNDVWFAWTSTQTGLARVSMCGGTTADTVIAAYPGSACPAAGSQLACDDDSTCGLPSLIMFNVTSGNVYLLQIGTYGTAVTFSGTFAIDYPAPPSNDDCTTPVAISGNGPVSFDNTFATTGTQGQAEAICNYGTGTGIQKDMWFTWTATFTSSSAQATTCTTTTANTKIAVYNGSGCPSAASIGCDDDSCGLQSKATFACVLGQTYTIQLGLTNAGTTGGTGTMSIVNATPPANDNCSSPQVISGLGPFTFNTTNATTGTAGQNEALCNAAAQIGIASDQWWLWTSTSTGMVDVVFCGGSTFDTKVAVYAGSSCPVNGSALACNDDSCGLQSRLAFPATSGNQYMIQSGLYPGATGGVGTFTLIPEVPPGNDDCSTPTVLSGPGPYSFDNTYATTGTQGQNESACNFVGGTAIARDVWYTWTATFTSNFALATTCAGTTLNTKISVFAGAGCPGAASIGCNDDSCGTQAAATFACVTGQTYTIQLGLNAAGTAGGTGTFRITDNSPPVNDDCSAPTALTGAGPFPFDNTNATTGSQGQTETLCNQYSTTGITQDEWYTWTPTMTGTATFTTCGGTASGMDTKVAVYDGAGCPTAGTALACNDDQGYPPTTTCTSNIRASTITWNTVCGHVYQLQLGRYPNAAASFGTFTITETGTTCNPGTGYCFGDGTGTACPCGNTGAAGNGCANSVNANGANLSASGTSSVSGDTLVLSGVGMPNSSCLFFQGTTQITTVFGDGLRCAGGQIFRLGTKINAGGTSQYPAAGDLPVSVRGFVPAGGGIRTYQCWYRNPANFCTVSTFNLSNGLQVTWAP